MDTPILSEGAAPADADLVKNTTTKDFMRDVIEASRDVPVLVDFWTPWCGPCQQLTPVLEKAVRAAKGAVKLVKLNIDENPDVPTKYGVRGIPTLMVFKDGQVAATKVGAAPKSQLQSWIEQSL